MRNLLSLFSAILLLEPLADAQQTSPASPQPEKKASQFASHGGTVHQVGPLQIEIVLETAGIKLFAYDQQGSSLDLRSAKGLATLQAPKDSKKYRYDLFPELRPDKSAGTLSAAVDLSRHTGQQVQLAIQLIGVQEGRGRPLQWNTTLLVPVSAKEQVAAAIAAQGVCPVSGEPLGSMGEALAVTLGEQTVYVCCAGCIDAVKKDPQKFLTAKQEMLVSSTTAADAGAIAAQKICPVMDEPLGGMGTPYKTIVEGHIVFLCCPGCAKKLHADPAHYFAKLMKQ